MRGREIAALIGTFAIAGQLAVVSLTANTVQSAAPRMASAKSDVSQHRAIVERYCVTCHSERLKTGGFVLNPAILEAVEDNASTLERVVAKLRGGLMPPAGMPRPEPAAHEALTTWLESSLDRAAAARPNVGRPETLHRLNRAEYQNAVRDLLAVDIDVAQLLPADDASYGFDNIAGALKLSDSLIERYLVAAEHVSRTAVGTTPPAVDVGTYEVPAGYLQDQYIEGLPLGTRGGLVVQHNFVRDGSYDFRIDLMCGLSFIESGCDGSAGYDDTHELQLLVDDEVVKTWSLPPLAIGARTKDGWRVRLPLKAGRHTVGVTFAALPGAVEVEGHRLRNDKAMWSSVSVVLQAATPYQPAVRGVTIAGPYDPGGVQNTPSRRRLFVCQPAAAADERACATEILKTVARRAYRGTASDADLQLLLDFYEQGRVQGGFDEGIELALRRLLMSPKFLTRVEPDPPRVAPGQQYRLTDLQLASRLSFFLWSSIPDDELLKLAGQNRLREPAALRQQVLRMLADSRAQALTQNFAGQWLQLRNLRAHRPSDDLFPNFDDSLREAMQRETELFFDSIVRQDRSVMDLLTADFTYVNERLAKHYGFQNITGSRFRRVTYPDDKRRGLLTHGSILLLTSSAIRTSPVKRGKWILTNILGTPPPDPPDDVPALEEVETGSKSTLTSVRERLAKHRSNPVCSSCHSMIDPAGFALENFDATGKWREEDQGKPVDASGVLPDGTKFNGAAEFRQALMSHPERFVRTMTERLLTYALGRGVEYYDKPVVRAIVRRAAQDDYRFSSLVLGTVTSLPFQMRQAR